MLPKAMPAATKPKNHYKPLKTPTMTANSPVSTGSARYPAPELPLAPEPPLPEPAPDDPFPLDPDRLQASSQPAFHVPLEVKLFKPVRLSTLVLLSHDQPLLIACPLSVTLETSLDTPRTVTLPRGLVSAKLPDGWAVTDVFVADSCQDVSLIIIQWRRVAKDVPVPK